jgi:acetyl-CoA synthetase
MEAPKMSERAILSTQQENRLFPPAPAFSAKAHVKSMDDYRARWKRSVEQPETFWSEVANELHWFKKWDRVLDWKVPDARWFVGASTNLAYNCLDRQIAAGNGNKTAIIFEGEPYANGHAVEVKRLTYSELKDEVCKLANGLKSLGVRKGDVVTIYLPMTAEAAIAMLACARIGAAHSVVFGGFSAQAIIDRVTDADSRFLITADGSYRRGATVALKRTVDEALATTPTVEKVIVLKRTGQDVSMKAGRDVWWSDLVDAQGADCPAEPMDAEDLLFVLYTSGSTGKPKGIRHTTAGYMVGTYATSKYVFDLQPDDIYWCTADIGWITGHSYVVYGLLNNGATVLMYEGAPNYPDFSRLWDIVQRHKVTIFYTAPTAIRAFMKAGRELVDKHDLSSLRLLGSVGEPINPEAWMWYHETIGHKRCPIVDTWWQTETGAIMITPLPGATPTKPGTATLPFFGIDAAIVDRNGKELGPNEGGLLVVRKPWPSMLRGIHGDAERYAKTYWSDVPGMYFTGDGARRDADGYFWIMGRIDDVVNVSGHRLGTAEIESALVAHPAVAESAVVGIPHEMKGQGLAAFVILKTGFTASEPLKKELSDRVAKEIGSFARPDKIQFADGLPKTRSGKIMRRLLREVAGGGVVKGDTTTLEDMNVIAKLMGPGAEEG